MVRKYISRPLYHHSKHADELIAPRMAVSRQHGVWEREREQLTNCSYRELGQPEDERRIPWEEDVDRYRHFHLEQPHVEESCQPAELDARGALAVPVLRYQKQQQPAHAEAAVELDDDQSQQECLNLRASRYSTCCLLQMSTDGSVNEDM